MSILRNLMYRLNEMPIKMSMNFFINVEKSVLIHMRNQRRPWMAKIILSKKNKAGGNKLLDFKIYYKDIVNKIVWFWHKQKYRTLKQNRDSKKKNTHINTQMIFDKVSRAHNGERAVSSLNYAGKTTYLRAEEWNCTLFSHHIKTNSKCIKFKHKTRSCKTMKRKHGRKAYWHCLGQWFSGHSKAQTTKIIDWLDYILKNIFYS